MDSGSCRSLSSRLRLDNFSPIDPTRRSLLLDPDSSIRIDVINSDNLAAAKQSDSLARLRNTGLPGLAVVPSVDLTDVVPPHLNLLQSWISQSSA